MKICSYYDGLKVLSLPVYRRVHKTAKSDCLLQICPSSRLSARNTSAQTKRIFMNFDIFEYFFKKTDQKIEVSLKSGKNNGYFTQRPPLYFCSYIAHFFLECEVLQTKVVKKKIKHTIFIQSLFFATIMPFLRLHGIILYSRTSYRLQYCACVLCAGKLRLHINLQPFHCNHGLRTRPSVMLYAHCLSCLYAHQPLQRSVKPTCSSQVLIG